jgi:inosine/xanthosine triphosphatase
MKVAVASRNPAKLRAVQAAFEDQFPGTDIESLGLAIASGVSAQPRSDRETRQGARNRAEGARHAAPDARFWVGLEGGIENIGEQLHAFAWMAVRGPNNAYSEARTVTLPLPPAVKVLVDQGMELGDANDHVFATLNSKQQDGAYGLLTEGRYTREGVYRQALVIALVPFVNPLYPSASGGRHE